MAYFEAAGKKISRSKANFAPMCLLSTQKMTLYFQAEKQKITLKPIRIGFSVTLEIGSEKDILSF